MRETSIPDGARARQHVYRRVSPPIDAQSFHQRDLLGAQLRLVPDRAVHPAGEDVELRGGREGGMW